MRALKMILKVVLWPLALIWENVYRIRRSLYKFGMFTQNSFEVPIISIGNLSFGGAGKTPFTLWLAGQLENREKKVMILMRGYKGKLENDCGVLHAGRKLGSNPSKFGDEALLFVRRLKHVVVVVGKNRTRNLKTVFPHEQPDVVLLDDGHQHLKLRRRTNIVLFDALLPVSSYRVAPLGYFREGLTALSEADAVVITRCDQVPPEKIEAIKARIRPYIHQNVPVGLVQYSCSGLYNSHFQRVFSKDELDGKKVICIAGIASPGSFYQMVEGFGAEIIEKQSFPDHYQFTAEDITKYLEKAEKDDALVITTEKDIVKIRRLVESDRLFYLEIDIRFHEGEEDIKRIVSSAL